MTPKLPTPNLPAPGLVDAATALAEALAAENDALRVFDLPRALAEFPRKVEQTRRLRLAMAALPPMDPALRAASLAAAERLTALGEENRLLLERAMFVQGRLIATLARAVPRPRAGYARAPATGARVAALTLSARA